MEREIKFRAWYQEEMYLWTPMCKGIVANFVEKPDIHIGVQLMQFTGLKDKNGKEIYEGDIIKRDWKLDGSLNKGQDLFICELKDQRWLHRIDLEEWSDIFEDRDEVIGNIHENSELLEVQKR